MISEQDPVLPGQIFRLQQRDLGDLCLRLLLHLRNHHGRRDRVRLLMSSELPGLFSSAASWIPMKRHTVVRDDRQEFLDRHKQVRR